MELVPLGDSNTPPEDGAVLVGAAPDEEVAFSNTNSDNTARRRRVEMQNQDQTARTQSQPSSPLIRETVPSSEERECTGCD